MAAVSQYDADFAFWTTERIRNSIPADKFLYTVRQQDQEYQPTGPGDPGSSENTRSVSNSRQIVGDELTTAPYQSVGRLTIHGEYTDVKGRVEKQTRHATAFYIGNSTLLTVAHVFSLNTSVEGEGISTFKGTEGGIFIPAMIPGVHVPDPSKNYGKFLIHPGRRGYFLHPMYDPQQRNAQYDICKVKLSIGMKDNVTLIDSIDSTGLRPFIIRKDENYTPRTTWRVVGYPGFHGWSNLLGMLEVGGIYHGSNQDVLHVNTRAEILHGMSGGPWIMEVGAHATMQEANMIVNGIQAGNPPSIDGACFAVSPYFSSDLFREMELQVDDGNQVDSEIVPQL